MADAIDFNEIGITNDVMFGSVFQDEENCKEFLQRILNIEIQELKLVENEKTIRNHIAGKGIRIDVYVRDMEGNSYDVEMQLENTGELPLRSRYYHSEMDGYQIKRGAKYNALKESIVIFVCSFDLFAKNRSIYRFGTLCKDDPGINLDDRRETYFVYISGSRDGLKDETVNLLDYFKTGMPMDSYTEQLEDRVRILRGDDEWRENYMTLETKLELKFEDGRKVGYGQGHEQGLQQGLQQGNLKALQNSVIDFLSDVAPVPEALKDRIFAIDDLDVLQQLNKKAARVTTIDEFKKIIES